MNKLCQIVGLGTYVPERILSNKDLEKMMDTTDEWIVSRTGIHTRHILDESKNTSDAGFYAAQKAIADAGIDAKEITHIFVATCTPDELSPSVSCIIAGKLGLSAFSGVSKISPDVKSLTCFDFNAACSGFIYGLEIARAFLALDDDATILLVAAETLSRRINYKDRSTAVLFGDGAGAVILRSKGKKIVTVHDVSCGSDGDLNNLIRIGGGTSMNVNAGDIVDEKFFLNMQGRDVFKHAVRCMVQESLKILSRNNLTTDDVDMFIAHQANARIIEAVGLRLEIPAEKVFTNVSRYGNTSAASILLALDEARDAGKVEAGKKILITTFGAGLTWASALFS